MTFSDIRTEAQLFNKDDDLASGATNEGYWLIWLNRLLKTISTQVELPDMLVREKIKIPKWHISEDTTNVFTLNPVNPEEPNALSKCIAGAIAFKAIYNAHIASTTYHAVADATNAISAASPTNLASLITLLDEADGDWNGHLVLATVHTDNDYNNEITENTSTTLTHCCEKYNALRKAYIDHILDYPNYVYIPPDCNKIVNVRFSDDNFFLARTVQQYLRTLDPDFADTGDLNYYAVYGNKLYFWKRTNDYLHIEYRREPKVLVDITDVPDGIPTQFHWILIHGILAASYKYVNEMEKYKMEIEEFNGGMQALKRYISEQVDSQGETSPCYGVN